MLNIKTRQTYLKALGFYKGEVDGLEGKLTKAAYLALQKAYFTRKSDHDGIYGTDTERLLLSVYRVKKHCKNFKVEEFKCQCGGKYCSGYPAALDEQFLKNIQKVRDKYGSVRITSGMRCDRHNANVGGSSGSRHRLGKAADFVVSCCSKESGRKQVMAYWKTLPNWRYTYCNIGGNYPNMGSAVHVDVS